MPRLLVSRLGCHMLRLRQGAQRALQPVAGSLAWPHVLTVRTSTEKFKSMGLNLEAGASCRFGGDGVNAAVINFGDCATCDTDEVMVMGWLARDVGVSAVGEVNSLNEVLVGEKFEETEDGGAPDAKAAPLGVGEEVGGGEVPLPTRDQGGEFATRPGKANPRLVKRLEQLSCHGGILAELRLSLNRRQGARNEARSATAGMIQA